MRTLAQLEQMLCMRSQRSRHVANARRNEARRARRERVLHLLHLLLHHRLLLLEAGQWDLHHCHAHSLQHHSPWQSSAPRMGKAQAQLAAKE